MSHMKGRKHPRPVVHERYVRHRADGSSMLNIIAERLALGVIELTRPILCCLRSRAVGMMERSATPIPDVGIERTRRARAADLSQKEVKTRAIQVQKRA